LEEGSWRAYRDFYRWSSIWQGAAVKPDWAGRLRHLAYAGGWRKLEPLWSLLIRARALGVMSTALETVLGRGRAPWGEKAAATVGSREVVWDR
jgi:hypothetical protein